MNKSIVAIAVAGLVGAVGFSSVASAEATVYGRVVAGAFHIDNDTATQDGSWDLGGAGQDGNGAPGSRIGFKGSQDLGNGMEAGFQIERGIESDKTTQRFNNVYISGGWGKLTLGQQGNAYNNARNWDQTFFYGGQHEIVGSRTEGIQYSMSNGPFSLNIMAMATDANEDKARAGDGATADAGGLDVTQAGNLEVSGDDSVDAWIFNAGYDFGVVNLNVSHYADNKDVDITEHSQDGMATAGAVTEAAARVAVEDARDAGRAMVDANASRDGTAIGVNGSFGPLDWYLAYQTSELNSNGYDNDVDSIGGFLGYKASERDTIYAYHVSHSADRSTHTNEAVAARGLAVGDISIGEDYTESVFGYSRSIGPGVLFIAEYQTRDLDVDGKDKGSDPNKLGLAIKYDF